MGYLTTGDTVSEGPTFPSADFIRIENSQETTAMQQFKSDPLTIGLTPGNATKLCANTPVAFAKTVYLYWQEALKTAVAKWGPGSFPQADIALGKAYTAMNGGAARTMGGALGYLGPQLNPVETATFWAAVSKVSIELGSKDFAVPYALPTSWLDFLDNVRQQTVAAFQTALDIGKAAGDAISKPVFALADLVRWGVIGGAGLALWWYVVRPWAAARSHAA